jgi:hypothetical protein
MITNHYVVHYKRGRVFISVPADLVRLRGERNIVAERVWQKLMGKDVLDIDVRKNLPTRKILMDELLSRYDDDRDTVFVTFKDKIQITLVRITHARG